MTHAAPHSTRSLHSPYRNGEQPDWTHRVGAKHDGGYTLIELIVVIVVIGILAAIAVPVYLNQQASARDSAATSDLVTYRKAMVMYSVENDGAYTNDIGVLATHGAVHSTQATPVVVVSGSRFCVELASDSSTTFFVTDRVSVRQGTCATSGDPAFTP